MVRGVNASSTYSLKTPSAGDGFCLGNGPSDISLAQFVLQQFGIAIQGGSFPGDPLQGYDIKSQDALQVLKLSLLALSNGEKFTEMYANGSGQVIAIEVGEEAPSIGNGRLIHSSSINASPAKIDHVVVHARAELPTRTFGPTVDLMGAGSSKQFEFSCPIGGAAATKNLTFAKESWVEFERSEQSKETQESLKAAVSRTNWENLVGYRAEFPTIPTYATMSPSPTSPDIASLPTVGNFEMTVPIGSDEPDSGGVIDVSGISMASAPVLDIQLGSTLVQLAGEKGIDLLADGSGLTEFDLGNYFVLLSGDCGLNSLSRGTNWYLLPTGNPDTAKVLVKESTANGIAQAALGGFAFDGLQTTVVYRADNGFIGSFQDVINANFSNGDSLLGSSVGVAVANVNHGKLIAGFGGNLGIEMWSMALTYTKQTSSIQIKSQGGDALGIANSVAAGGINYTPIIITEEPPCAGLAPGGLICPVAPPNEETEKFCPETALDVLEGSVMEMSAPWLGRDEVVDFANNLYNLVTTDNNNSGVYTYSRGGYSIYPGMAFQGSTVQSIEFNYADKSSQTTNITTGPKFYQSGSAGGDSRYIKRTETINKPGVVIGGHNESGSFSVQVDGLGIYEAINGQIDPIYPGDKVEVKIVNFPVER